MTGRDLATLAAIASWITLAGGAAYTPESCRPYFLVGWWCAYLPFLIAGAVYSHSEAKHDQNSGR